MWLIIILYLYYTCYCQLYRLVPVLFTPVQQFHPTCPILFTPVQLHTFLIFEKFLLCLITLCAYAQQCYAFGCVYIYVCVCVCVCESKTSCLVQCTLLFENLLLSVMRCLLFKFKCLKRGLLHPASCTE